MNPIFRQRFPVRSRTFALTRDFPNPESDLRFRKSSVSGTRLFKCGDQVHATDYEQEWIDRDGVRHVETSTQYEFIKIHGLVGKALAKLIAEQDPRVQPKPASIEDLAVEAGVSEAYLCVLAVRHLLKTGKLTLEEVDDAFDSCEQYEQHFRNAR